MSVLLLSYEFLINTNIINYRFKETWIVDHNKDKVQLNVYNLSPESVYFCDRYTQTES